ncbi:MAG: putative acyl-CoA synthetase, long-chain fatty acid:CoA ligase [Acidimicrobiales bacterium]|nr:putative acyl-CoA synthetase, long-chain fatty acid:CoA ligase [Acidimicrobiales bacterium]
MTADVAREMSSAGGLLGHPGGKAAVVMASDGEIITYRDLETRSRRLAALLHDRGLRAGDRVAVLLDNHPRMFEVFWAAQRIGLYTVPINWHLQVQETAYIINDSGAKALIATTRLLERVSDLDGHIAPIDVRLCMDGQLSGFESYERALDAAPETELDEVEGSFMFYSSGTTGRPKGIKPPLSGGAFGTGGDALVGLLRMLYGFDADSIYLCPAPLYHAAPLGWSTTVHRLGGTVVVMEKFDPLAALQLIEQHRVTHAQFVPTHFIRMLKLPDVQRLAPDLSTLQTVVHAAAPCPIEVKRQMLEWLGPKLFEYYAGSEGNGFCAIGPDEWLSHPGSVGRPVLGVVHVVGGDGQELAPGEDGQIWFESAARFEYHNDPDKTAGAFDAHGWSSLGDIGHVDSEGYVYLTDRASHMIISGGVNIYPQEIENELALHPAIADVAVIGVPNAEFGEEVKAIIVAADPSAAGHDLAMEILAFCRQRLAGYKCPASVDFVEALPRLPTGKLLKRQLRDAYSK